MYAASLFRSFSVTYSEDCINFERDTKLRKCSIVASQSAPDFILYFVKISAVDHQGQSNSGNFSAAFFHFGVPEFVNVNITQVSGDKLDGAYAIGFFLNLVSGYFPVGQPLAIFLIE